MLIATMYQNNNEFLNDENGFIDLHNLLNNL